MREFRNALVDTSFRSPAIGRAHPRKENIWRHNWRTEGVCWHERASSKHSPCLQSTTWTSTPATASSPPSSPVRWSFRVWPAAWEIT